VSARSIRNSQASAEVAGIGYAIQQQKEGWALQSVEQGIEVSDGFGRTCHRNYALMSPVRAQGVKPRGRHRTSDNPNRGGQRNEIADSPVVSTSVHIEFAHTAWIPPQSRADRMKSVNQHPHLII
jgi:hypothetical protein